MDFDFTINISDVLTVIGLAAGATWAWFNMDGRVKVNARMAEDARTAAAATEASLRLLKDQLYEHKNFVATEYITKDSLRETMTALSASLQSIDANMRHLSERIDRLFDQKQKRPD